MPLVLNTSGNFAYAALFGFSRAEDDLGPYVANLYTARPVSPSDVLSDYTLASFPGYAQLTVYPWSGIRVNAGNTGFEQDWGPLFWILSEDLPIPGVTVTGYVVSDPGGNVLWANDLAGGYIFLNSGDMLTVSLLLDVEWRYA